VYEDRAGVREPELEHVLAGGQAVEGHLMRRRWTPRLRGLNSGAICEELRGRVGRQESRELVPGLAWTSEDSAVFFDCHRRSSAGKLDSI
jgi:hypothetical protein